MLGLRHLNLNVSDINRSVAFYSGCFDLAEISRTTEAGIERHGCAQTLVQAVLFNSQTRDLVALSHWETGPVGGGGLDHFGFILESDTELESILGKVSGLGGTIERSGEREDNGITERYAYVRDPDGYAIELSTQAGLYSRAQGVGAA